MTKQTHYFSRDLRCLDRDSKHVSCVLSLVTVTPWLSLKIYGVPEKRKDYVEVFQGTFPRVDWEMLLKPWYSWCCDVHSKQIYTKHARQWRWRTPVWHKAHLFMIIFNHLTSVWLMITLTEPVSHLLARDKCESTKKITAFVWSF